MGHVKTHQGTQIQMDEVEGVVTLQDLYQDLKCEQYTAGYRVLCMKACGNLGRQAWGVLHDLHEIAKGLNVRLANAAEDAINKIDPGRPNLKNPVTTGTAPTIVRKNHFSYQNGNGVTVQKKLEIRKVELADIPVNGDLSEGARVFGTCCFCEKTTIFPKQLIKYCEQVVGPDKNNKRRLYCNYCMRNEFYKLKYSKNMLILSFRGLIGYYYYCFHYYPKTTGMLLSDLYAYIDLHVRMGIQNPLFRYDPESFCWFIDFSKVGNRPKQMPLEYVLETIISILSAFNMYEHVKDASPATFYQKFKEAVVDFHHHRRRPPGQRILTPTMFSCGIPTETMLNKAIPIQHLKSFLPSNMNENLKHARTRTGCG